MIESKDLRIGNYLVDEKTGSYLKVTDISENSFSTYVIDRSKFPLPDGWKATPIPLTEEILINNGFEHRSEHRGEGAIFDFKAWKPKFAFLVYREYEKNGGKWGTGGTSCNVKIEYVHQLQNLIYSISGGREIEINL